MEFFTQIDNENPSFFSNLKEAFLHTATVANSSEIRIGVVDHGVFYLKGLNYPRNLTKFWISGTCVASCIDLSTVRYWMQNNRLAYCSKIDPCCILESVYVGYDITRNVFITNFKFGFLPSTNAFFYMHRFIPFTTLGELAAIAEECFVINWEREGF